MYFSNGACYSTAILLGGSRLSRLDAAAAAAGIDD